MQTHLITAAPCSYAIYALRHEQTKRVYIGSTSLLRDRLRLWFYAIEGRSKAYLPDKMTETLLAHGRVPIDWSWKILDDVLPADYDKYSKSIERPEWPLLARLQSQNPELMLNNPVSATRYDPNHIYPAQVTSRRGIQPLTHLAVRLGLKAGRKYQGMPPHSWYVDHRTIVPFGNPMVSFACYLLRSCKAMQPRSINPSPAAVEGLFAVWLRQVPTGALELGVPYTASDLAVTNGNAVNRMDDCISPTRGSLLVGTLQYAMPATVDAALAFPLPAGYTLT